MPEQIIDKINKSIQPVNKVKLPKTPGLYGIFLGNDCSLGEFAQGHKLIYLGKSENSLAKRIEGTHLKSGKTGSSTLRRSIGAILKSELNLKAIPRSPNGKPNDFYNYKFTMEGEERLTNWMKANLEIGISPLPSISTSELKELEKGIIEYASPALNLDKNIKSVNPLIVKLEALRKICKEEAEETSRS